MQDGQPCWIPPAHIDPDQEPIRNSMHAIDQIDADGIPEQLPRLPGEIC